MRGGRCNGELYTRNFCGVRAEDGNCRLRAKLGDGCASRASHSALLNERPRIVTVASRWNGAMLKYVMVHYAIAILDIIPNAGQSTQRIKITPAAVPCFVKTAKSHQAVPNLPLCRIRHACRYCHVHTYHR
jgi:hypothetical protein